MKTWERRGPGRASAGSEQPCADARSPGPGGQAGSAAAAPGGGGGRGSPGRTGPVVGAPGRRPWGSHAMEKLAAGLAGLRCDPDYLRGALGCLKVAQVVGAGRGPRCGRAA